MYSHLTNEELLRVTPASKLETELLQRLDCCLECLAQKDGLEDEWQKAHSELEEFNQVVLQLKIAIKRIATEIHRCADEGAINITDEFITACQDFVDDIDELVDYPYPHNVDVLKEVQYAS